MASARRASVPSRPRRYVGTDGYRNLIEIERVVVEIQPGHFITFSPERQDVGQVTGRVRSSS